MFVWFSFAAPTILNPSYSVNWNEVKIYWTNNSDGWYVTIAVQDPKTWRWLPFGEEVKISDQVFTYTKQWDWDQNIWMTPWDGWDEIKFIITWDKPAATVVETEKNTKEDADKPAANRTVIPAVPKTGPSWSLIWIILATFAIFGGYIYIRKRADI